VGHHLTPRPLPGLPPLIMRGLLLEPEGRDRLIVRPGRPLGAGGCWRRGVPRASAKRCIPPRYTKIRAGRALYTASNINRVSAQAAAVQLSDGRVGDGSLYEAPQVYPGDDSLSIVQARSSTAGLIEIAALAAAVPRGEAVNIVVGPPLPAASRWVATRVSWAVTPTFPAAKSLICSRHRALVRPFDRAAKRGKYRSSCHWRRPERTHPGSVAGQERSCDDCGGPQATGANTSRAAVVNARTLEVLDDLDMSRRLVKEGMPAPRFTIRDGRRILIPVDFSVLRPITRTNPTRRPVTRRSTRRRSRVLRSWRRGRVRSCAKPARHLRPPYH
jgi:hypothetical protein